MLPIQKLEVVTQNWVRVPDSAKVALEVLHIDRIEADQGGVCADVEFRHLRTEEIWSTVLMGDLL